MPTSAQFRGTNLPGFFRSPTGSNTEDRSAQATTQHQPDRLVSRRLPGRQSGARRAPNDELTLRPRRSATPLHKQRGVSVFPTGQPLTAAETDETLYTDSDAAQSR